MSSSVSRFLPILAPTRPPRPRRAARRVTTAGSPPLLKPRRLTSAASSPRRNRRGRGLPGCGRGVTVPISTKPKPKRSIASGTSASLSKPAASPTGFGNSRPQSLMARLGASGADRRGATPKRNAAIVTRCAVSGGSVRSSGSARSNSVMCPSPCGNASACATTATRARRVSSARDRAAGAVYSGGVRATNINDASADAVALPAAPALVAGVAEAAWLSPDGEIALLSLAEAARRARDTPPFVCHARATARRLGVHVFPAFDLLELHAFVRPARFCLPTPRGLAAALGLPLPQGGLADAALVLLAAARALLAELKARGPDGEAHAVALAMERGGWGWGAAVLAALGEAPAGGAPAGLAIWRKLPEWAEHAPAPPPGNHPVDEAEARRRLADILGQGAEARPQQSDYAAAVSAAFRPRQSPDEPQIVLAEAGTGVGKTLGYVAPASLWAEKNEGAVWISTYTRNLQHQVAGELDRLYPEAAEKSRRVVLRKGRENYLCLLNYEEGVAALPMRPYDAAALGIMARWIAATRDGDMVGGDFPGWLPDVVGRPRSLGLADRRGECIHSACPHSHRCFVEKSIRRARRARIVVANHALVMVQAALGGLDDTHLPTRFVFDEGHHVFEAADGAFSLALTAQEAAELRHWLLGAEGGRRGRARGLRRRLEDLVMGDQTAERALAAILVGARVLPAEGWAQRLAEARPQGPAEAFLALVRQQVHARAHGREQAYSLETELRPPIDGLVEAGEELALALEKVSIPLRVLAERLKHRLDDDAADLDQGQRFRIEAAARGLERRGIVELGG